MSGGIGRSPSSGDIGSRIFASGGGVPVSARGRSATRSSRTVSGPTFAAAALKTDTTSRFGCEGATSRLVRIGLLARRWPRSESGTSVSSGHEGPGAGPGDDITHHREPSLPRPGPRHVLRVRVCPALQAPPAVGVAEDRVHRLGELLRVAE